MFVIGLSDNIRGPLFPQLISFFAVSNTQASLTYAISACFGFIGSLYISRLLKWTDLQKLLQFSLLLMGFSLLLIGTVNHFYIYLMGSAFFGLSMGFLGVVQNLMITESFSGSSQSKALSGLHAIYGLSSLVAPIVASSAFDLTGNWRAAYFVASILSIFIFTLSYLIKNSDLKRSEKIESQHLKKDELDLKKNYVVNSFYKKISLGGVLGFYVVAEILVSSRLALYMQKYHQMDLHQSSRYVSGFFVFLLLGRILFTFKSFKATLRKQLNVLLITSCLFLILGLIIHPLFLVLTGLMMAPFYPLSLAYIAEESGKMSRIFITFAIAMQNICIIFMHMGVGWLTDQFGLFYAFGVGVVSLVLALLCVNFHSKIKFV